MCILMFGKPVSDTHVKLKNHHFPITEESVGNY